MRDAVTAPTAGVLLGLPARGARIEPGDIVVEVDPIAASCHCLGVSDTLRSVATNVVSMVDNREFSPKSLFPIEPALAR